MLLKGNFARKIVAGWCGRGSGLKASWERFPWHWSWLQSRDESAPIWRWISPNHGVIGPRSNHDREPRSWFNFNRCSPIWSGRLGGPDRVIKLIFRLPSDGDSPPDEASTVWWRSDAPCVSTKRRRLRFTMAVRSGSPVLYLMTIGRFSWRHVS